MADFIQNWVNASVRACVYSRVPCVGAIYAWPRLGLDLWFGLLTGSPDVPSLVFAL